MKPIGSWRNAVAICIATALGGCSADTGRELERLTHELERVRARGEVENVFNRYQYLHSYFRDEEIIEKLWVKPGTPGISAQYTNSGIYNTWETVMQYHRNRPSPAGKLLFHYTASPVIEVAADGQTAKGVWVVAGVESGLSSPAAAAKAPAAMFEPGLVDGKKVWAHWIQVRYHVDFLRQDGEWRIWHFRAVEVSRAPFSQNWIAFGAQLQANAALGRFHNDLAYFGEDGEPVFMPPVDAPPKNVAPGYRTDQPMQLIPPLPEPYETFAKTFEY
ncbi:MAG: nuclear transport factor 2 family protein [Steroidobacteraceae bacterium]|nr:nuclear transport factor 2 family protein [Steroidobacteraceae bacterium]MDW8259301.1 nuclear transport factor 2 family protein [Gammaproteobacteria bacterium]